MEALSLMLQPYKDLVGNAAAITTVMQFFSPAFLCNDIRKQGNTNGFSVMPFMGGLIIGVLNLQYGLMLRDDTMIRVSFAGVLLNILYLMLFFYFATSKGTVWLQMGAGGALTAAIVGYVLQQEDPAVAQDRLGIIVTVLMLLLIASPLFDLKEIIKTKSTAGMPFPIIFSGTIVTFLWLLYGVIIANEFVIFQNVVGFALSAVQLFLMTIYPSKPSSPKKSSKKQKKN